MKRYDTSSHIGDTFAWVDEVLRHRERQRSQKKAGLGDKEPVVMWDYSKETGVTTLRAILFPSNDNE